MLTVLMACHNRREKTVACVKSLQRSMPEILDWTLVLADDGCTDGTADAVRELVGDRMHHLHGDGSWFWNCGMLAAWEHALTLSPLPDAVLWLNDDVILEPDHFRRLLERRDGGTTLVGAVGDPDNPSNVTYGGWAKGPWWNRLKGRTLSVVDEPTPCATCNGNVVLVEKATWETHGLLDPIFLHAMGDLDYGWRLSKGGNALVVVPGTVGTCEPNHGGPKDSLKSVLGPLQLPFRSWYALTSRHAGPLWPLLFLKPYVRAAIASLATKLRIR